MRKTQLALFLCVFLVGFLSVSCSSAPTEPPTPAATPTLDVRAGQELVASRCSVCHAVGVIEAAKYDQAGWKATVERMVAKGAILNPDQQSQAVDYLALTFTK